MAGTASPERPGGGLADQSVVLDQVRRFWEYHDDKVARERIYVMEGWEAPEWRARWRSDTPADPPE
jgi:hypothetical protein